MQERGSQDASRPQREVEAGVGGGIWSIHAA
jgi:hypothetical protein